MTKPVPSSDDLRRGALYAVAAAAAFAVLAACVKAAAATVSNEVIVFFRSATGLLLLLPWLVRRGAGGLATRRFGGHLWRALFGICAMYCFFYAIARLDLSEAVLLTYSTPLFIPFIAWAWLREPPTSAMLPAAGLGFAGLALIVKPQGTGLVSLAGAVGVCSAVFAAAAWVGIRRIADTEPAARIVFYFSALSTLVSAVPLAWSWRQPESREWVWLIATGVFATIGQFCLTRAYALAPAARVGPFIYASVVFAGLIGWLAWGERPDALSLTGMVLVIACCVLAGRR